MRSRIWASLTLIILVLLAACSGPQPGQGSGTVAPTKTLRPTFTPVRPAAAATSAPAAAPAATQAPAPAAPTVAPTVPPAPTAKPAPATPVPPTAVPKPLLTISEATVNVRSGPGTNYPVIAKATQGQQFEVTGKTAAGDWWQFTYEGQSAWVSAGLVSINDAASRVQAVTNIPEPPVQPTAPPPPPAAPTTPPQPPAAALRFNNPDVTSKVNTNSWITVWCVVTDAGFTVMRDSTLRVSGPSGTKEVAFGGRPAVAYPGPNEFHYNEGCKAEMALADGTYTAYLIQGGSRASGEASFTVSGTNREFVLYWRER